MSNSMQDHEAKPMSGPKIGYHRALARRFSYEGVMYTVEECPPSVLLAFLASCPVPGKQKSKIALYQQQRAALLQELAGECDMLARWYVIDTLLVQNFALPFEA